MNKTREGFDKHGKYIEEERANGWRKFKREVNGHSFKLIGSDTDDYIEAIKSTGLQLKLNTMSDRMEVTINGNGTRPLNDFDESVLLGRLLDYDMKNEGYMRKSMHTLAVMNKYHPVREYLDSLQWDGRQHFIALMSKLEMTSPLAEVFWRKFLIGSIAKILHGHQNYMLVLLGGQGKGKSRLVRWLCPLPHLFHEGPIAPDNKDDQIRLINNWLWEVAELDSTTKRSERSALKYFITMKQVKVRVPYGRYDIDKTAAASMIGTINNDGSGFLNDPTGNRRFAVVHLEDIGWDYETTVDVNQLWAELYQAYKDGEAWELTRHEQEIQSEINNTHLTASPLEDLLLEWFEVDPSQDERFMSTMDILEKLELCGLKGEQFRNKMELGTVLTKLGLKQTQRRVNNKRQRGYVGIWPVNMNEVKL